MTAAMIGIGNFFFKYRNQLFPAIIVALFLLAPPVAHGSTAVEQVSAIVAILLVLAGLGLRATVIGYAYIQRGGLNKRVYAKDLVTEGMFGVCRNPLYVGNMLIYSGVFLFSGNPLAVVLGIGLFAFLYQCIVLAEEEFLEKKFGDAYRAYCRDVPRWALRLRRFRSATEGMAFNVRRVIAKDYSTMSATLITLLVIEFYRAALNEGLTQSLPYLAVLAGLLALIGLATGAISRLKKRGVFSEPKPIH
ncbi:protein-S-isoprenylcysteine O-methyltransferase Ste14 [Mycoplana sp. BE70]|uniref:methyltransferase family protein n=1 Tax=Mycoplana sp. BE70 TaxID=2817775 RepID=UPI00285DF1C2|nr:isoprenylcysteine carboxylmethyltransferase family protein [Mycoplana sp. BE70]MDR6756965.1 protein-S-isoprenylcysteine O-methyltransferase Ste14 [Mycoplana sp. BE70]